VTSVSSSKSKPLELVAINEAAFTSFSLESPLFVLWDQIKPTGPDR